MILLNSSRACQVHSLLLVLEPQQQAAAGRLRGLTSVLGSAVAGAAKVAGASAAAIAAAGGPLIVTVPEPSQAVSSQGSSRVGTVRLTNNFCQTGYRVRASDVAAVQYYILQQLPLLPSTSHPTAAVAGTEQGGAEISTELGSGQQKQQPSGASSLCWQPDCQQQQQVGDGSSHLQPQLLLQLALGGFTTSLHTVYFDKQRYSCTMAGCTSGRRRRRSRRGRLGRCRAQMAARA
jgi:hypothetical protein